MQNFSLQVRRLLCSPAAIYISLGLCFFLGLNWVPLFDLDEGAFTEATREMLHSGIFSATYLDGIPRYDKPIFFYWLQAGSISLFGFNEWAFRFPSAAMACFWAYAVLSFSREFIGKHRGLIAALFLINSLWIALIARSAIADATLNLFLCLAMFDIWRYFQRPSKPIILRVYLWMALATLTKGPVGVVIPLLTSVIYLLTARADKKQYLAYFNPLGWLVFIGVVTPWLIAVYLQQGLGFFEGFIVEHNLERFSATRESHGGTIFYYLAVLPLLVLPLTGQLGGVFGKLKSQLTNPLNRFLLIWFSVFFVIFSFSKTQLPHYILNGCVPLIILFARNFKLHRHGQWFTLFPLAFLALLVALPKLVALASSIATSPDIISPWQTLANHAPMYFLITAIPLAAFMLSIKVLRLTGWSRLWSTFVTAILITLPIIVTLKAGSIKSFDLANLSKHESVFSNSYTITSIIAFLLLSATVFLPKIRTWQRLVLAGLILNTFVYTAFASVASGFQQTPVHEAIAFLEKRAARIGKDETIVEWRMQMPSFSVYRQKITLLRPPQMNELVLTRVDRIKSLNEYLKSTIPNSEAVPIWKFGGLLIFKVMPIDQLPETAAKPIDTAEATNSSTRLP